MPRVWSGYCNTFRSRFLFVISIVSVSFFSCTFSMCNIMNHLTQHSVVPCLFCAFALFVAGCGGSERPPGFPKLYPVSLKVAQEGQPLGGASVSLKISDNSMTWSIGGKTDEQGLAILWTHGKFRGAPIGTFKVAVEKIFNEGEAEMLEAANREDFAAANKIQVNSFSFVKDEYSSVSTTPIEIEITKNSKEIEIDAGPAVKIKREYMR